MNELYPDYAKPESLNRKNDFERAVNNSNEVKEFIQALTKEQTQEIKNKFMQFKELKIKNKHNISNFDFYMKLVNALDFIALYALFDISKETYYSLRTISEKLDDLTIIQNIMKETNGDLRTNHTTTIRIIAEPYTNAILSLVNLYGQCYAPNEDSFMGGIGAIQLGEKETEKEIKIDEIAETNNL